MDAAGKVGLGLSNTRPDTAFTSGLALSTAPASPMNDMALQHTEPGNTTTTTTTSSITPHSTMAQLSFGPATQQTVTTVTTTTTVSLPPLVIKPPKDLAARDPKQYPLAFTPTPHNIKRFCFDVNNHPTVFREAEDPEETARQRRHLLASIEKHNGFIRQQDKGYTYDTPPHSINKQLLGTRRPHALKRTASPPSLLEAAELARIQRTKKPRSHLHPQYSDSSEHPSISDRLASSALSLAAGPAPVTPHTNLTGTSSQASASTAAGTYVKDAPHRARSRLGQQQFMEDDGNMEIAGTDSQEDEEQDALQPSSLYRRRRNSKWRFEHIALSESINATAGATPTPPIAENEMDGDFELVDRPQQSLRPGFPSLLTSSQQDASLPSPSLSPITAAANLASRQIASDISFPDQNIDDAGLMSGLELEEDENTGNTSLFQTMPGRRHSPLSSQPATFKSGPAQEQHDVSGAGPTIMDIPTMIDAFDNMPEAMQSYLIYQFLRRCAKPTLQMVANVVNPALKCDPFNVLPTELGLNITRFLDAQSMCRAAQVSKRWRRLISSDEKAWKDLLERDEFVLPQGEIERAVREGWGWQHPGENGFEEDLGMPTSRASPETAETSIISDDELTTSSTVITRTSRKRLKGASKRVKRRPAQASSSVAKPVPLRSKVSRQLENARSATQFAAIATHAVPHPGVGLDSLRTMHLFKSLYQRHHLIRKAWMMEDSQPKHLAFRAHHRHVVTCLLFDSDQILTGSDDTKINVYDTNTGELRKRLEGHEGGVWALQYDGNILVSGSTDRSVRVWNIATGECLQTFQGHTSTVRCLVILKPVQIGTGSDGTPIMMPKEPLIITGSRDSTLRVWRLPKEEDEPISGAVDRENPYFLRTLAGHHNSVRAIAAHGDTLVSGSYDCTVRVWEISTGNLVHRLQGHTQKVYSVVLDHERGRCISGSMDNFVRIWDLQSGASLFTLEGHTSLVGLLDLSHDRLVSAAADSTLRIWDPESGACKATLSAHTGAITCFQHDGQKVISGSDRTLKMWNVKNGECVRDLLTELSGVWQVRFDERRCVAAVQRNNLTYIEVLDFGASRDGLPESERGRRVLVDHHGHEVEDDVLMADAPVDDANAAVAAAGP